MWVLTFFACLYLASSSSSTSSSERDDSSGAIAVVRKGEESRSSQRSLEQQPQNQHLSKHQHQFWDLESFVKPDEREKLLRTALDITELEGYIDWELLRDNYIKAVLEDDLANKLNTNTPESTSDASASPSLSTTATITTESTHEDLNLAITLVDDDYEDDVADSSKEIDKLDSIQQQRQRQRKRLRRRRRLMMEGNRQLRRGGLRKRKRTPKRKKKKMKRTRINKKKRASSSSSSSQEEAKVNSPKATTPTSQTSTNFATSASPPSTAAETTTSTSTNFGGTTGSILIPIYKYNLGKCPAAGDSPQKVPCAPADLKDICDKYNSKGSFRNCLEKCQPSFCCIHNAPATAGNTPYAPNCNTDANCGQYAPCYIAWWKLADHIGPATRLRVEQPAVPFYDIPASEITGVLQASKTFYYQFLFHFFKDQPKVIQLGSVTTSSGTNFDIDRIILNKTYWETNV